VPLRHERSASLSGQLHFVGKHICAILMSVCFVVFGHPSLIMEAMLFPLHFHALAGPREGLGISIELHYQGISSELCDLSNRRVHMFDSDGD